MGGLGLPVVEFDDDIQSLVHGGRRLGLWGADDTVLMVMMDLSVSVDMEC